jgi:hypothetical protein
VGPLSEALYKVKKYDIPGAIEDDVADAGGRDVDSA